MNLKHDKLPSNIAFNLKVRHYTGGMMREFATAVWGAAAHVEGLVIGNVTAQEALGLGHMIRSTLKVRPPPCMLHPS